MNKERDLSFVSISLRKTHNICIYQFSIRFFIYLNEIKIIISIVTASTAAEAAVAVAAAVAV